MNIKNAIEEIEDLVESNGGRYNDAAIEELLGAAVELIAAYCVDGNGELNGKDNAKTIGTEILQKVINFYGGENHG